MTSRSPEGLCLLDAMSRPVRLGAAGVFRSPHPPHTQRGPPSGPLGSPAATLSDLLPCSQAAPRLLSRGRRVHPILPAEFSHRASTPPFLLSSDTEGPWGDQVWRSRICPKQPRRALRTGGGGLGDRASAQLHTPTFLPRLTLQLPLPVPTSLQGGHVVSHGVEGGAPAGRIHQGPAEQVGPREASSDHRAARLLPPCGRLHGGMLGTGVRGARTA